MQADDFGPVAFFLQALAFFLDPACRSISSPKNVGG
jgi:hypothetical protein